VQAASRSQFRLMREGDQSRPDVAGFDCGHEPYSWPVAEALTSGEAWATHQSGIGQTWLMEVDGRIAGFVNTRKHPLSYPKWNGKRRIPVLEVAWIGVSRDFQRRGLATFMLRSIIIEANDDPSVDKVYLLVHEDNPFIARYRELGFYPHPTAPLHEENGAKHLRMLLDLAR
jgi:ribosomal protein S18 acetylase RimI-like enzyme